MEAQSDPVSAPVDEAVRGAGETVAPERVAVAGTSSPKEKPLLEVTGGRARVSRDTLREFWIFREVLLAFAIRQVKVRYKQAAIGLGWTILQPIIAAALFAVFLGRLSGISSEGVPYLLFAIAGMVAWNFFSAATSTGIDSLVTNQAMLRKIYFPREILPIAAVAAALVDLIPALVTLGVVAALYGVSPSLPWIATPLVVLILLFACIGLSLPLSAVNVYYRDVRYAIPFLLQLGLFASPVVYSIDVIPASWRQLYTILNPAAAAIDGLRAIFVHSTWPDFTVTFAALAWTAALVGLGLIAFKRIERGISDRV